MKIKVSKITNQMSSLSLAKNLEDELDELSLNKIYDEDVSDNEDSFQSYEKKWKHDSDKEYLDVIKYLNILNKLEKDILKKKINDKIKKDFKFMFYKIYYKVHIFKKNIIFDRNHETYQDDYEDFLEILEKIHSNIITIINNKKLSFTKEQMLKSIKTYKTLLTIIKNFVQRNLSAT